MVVYRRIRAGLGDTLLDHVATDENCDQLIERLAAWIEQKGLSGPAVLFLEANKPLSFVASQTMLLFQPILSLAVNGRLPEDLALLFEDRAKLDRLIRRLERGRG
ncbi:MAG: hypothetical protein HYX94_11690 [Chloroflexi bacterium]|nr:hypothetical protein [Chloroflexota bacterium]